MGQVGHSYNNGGYGMNLGFGLYVIVLCLMNCQLDLF